MSIVQTVLLLGHWFIYATVAYFWGGAAASWQAKLALGILSISFVLSSLRGWYAYDPLARIAYAVASVWLGFASYFLFASAACWLALGLSAVAHLGWQPAWIAGILFAVAIAIGLYGIINAASPRVTRITVALPGLPAQWRGRTAVMVSDLHLGHIRNIRFARRVVEKIAALQPDIVFVAGDLYDGVAADFARLAQPWALLTASAQARFGVFYIAGNHEEFYRNAEYLPPLLKAGIKVLDNEKVEVDGLQLAGVHYSDAAKTERYRSILRGMQLDRQRASILLLHAPVQLPISDEEGIALQFSGHTHGGQFFPWTLIGKRVWGKFNHGLARFGNLQVYTGYGTGTWGPPFRVATWPEIVLVKFE
jgi:predicted MPP superfamily phosphohydrolase